MTNTLLRNTPSRLPVRVKGLRAVLVVGAFLFGIPVSGGWAAQAKERREIRYGVYFLGSRIGESTMKQAPTQFKGKAATRIDSTTAIKLVALSEVSQTINLTHIMDAQTAPLFLTMKMESGGHTTSVAATRPRSTRAAATSKPCRTRNAYTGTSSAVRAHHSGAPGCAATPTLCPVLFRYRTRPRTCASPPPHRRSGST